ncbi:hypothetical protein K431DRAFT_290897 [Polychaeton citri CBS 116435]|uniref:Uncharacterized protein n=1 Tax=Polychaeton citri CBS 116435 TaxID=1314669 RepID=A0A9P4QFC3_9PEZI|nr:hypothetical protein K431DRAFT_290897 [Polychaeton citri CBS 116435]
MSWPAAGSENHFNEDWRFVKESVRSVKGYDTHNGLHDSSYVPVESDTHPPIREDRTVHTVSTGRSRKANVTKRSAKSESIAKAQQTIELDSVATESTKEPDLGQGAPDDPPAQSPLYDPNLATHPQGHTHIHASYGRFPCYQAYPLLPQQHYYYPWLPPPPPTNIHGGLPPYPPQNYCTHPHHFSPPPLQPPHTVVIAPAVPKSDAVSDKKSEASVKKPQKPAKASEKAASAKGASTTASSTKMTSTKAGFTKAFSAKQPLEKGSAMECRTTSAAAPNRHIYIPVKEDVAKLDVKAWVGRTKNQVDEDNMRIAKAEDAYKGCKVQPVDVSDQQFFWVVDADGTNTLRTFRDIKDLKGEWQPDPRFPRAWFFQREKEGE